MDNIINIQIIKRKYSEVIKLWDGIINLIDNITVTTISICAIWFICAVIVKFGRSKQPNDNNTVKCGDKVKLVITDAHAIEQIQVLEELQEAYNHQICALQEIVSMQEQKLTSTKPAMQVGSVKGDYDKLSDISIRLIKSISDNNIKIAKLKGLSDKTAEQIYKIMCDNATEVRK